MVQLFKDSQKIFPPACITSNQNGFALSEGVHSFPFEVHFPTSSACHKPQPGIAHSKTALPPSFSFKAPKRQGSATVRYWLRVKVQRKGRYRVDPSQDQELIFAPSSPVPVRVAQNSPSLSKYSLYTEAIDAWALPATSRGTWHHPPSDRSATNRICDQVDYHLESSAWFSFMDINYGYNASIRDQSYPSTQWKLSGNRLGDVERRNCARCDL